MARNPFADKVPQAQESIVSPRKKYIATLNNNIGLTPKMREGMNILFELGFTDYKINITLLEKYEGDSNAAAEHIIVHGTQGILQE